MKAGRPRLFEGAGIVVASLFALYVLGFAILWTDASLCDHGLVDRLPRPIYRGVRRVYGKVVPGFYRSIPPYTIW